MGLKLNGRYISLILAVQIGKWTAKFGIKLCAPKPGRCMQKRNVELSGADGRGLGRRRDPPLPAPAASFPGASSPFFALARQGGAAGQGADFLFPLTHFWCSFSEISACSFRLRFSPLGLPPFFPARSLRPHERLRLYLLFGCPPRSFPPIIWELRP